jgi:hypothetical protein
VMAQAGTFRGRPPATSRVAIDPLAELIVVWNGEATSAAEIAAFVKVSRPEPAA